MSLARLARRIAVRIGLMQRPPPPQPAAFDAAWYCAQLPESEDARPTPWAHYASAGWRRGLSPSPLFDTARYLRLYPDVARTATEPLWHYLTLGWREGRSPHALFDADWYGLQRSSTIDPLTDYLTAGWKTGCSPHPLFHVRHYRARRGGAPGRCDLADYLGGGWRAGFDPHPYFSIAHYRGSGERLDADVEPLTHYAQSGYREGRTPHPGFDPPFYRAQYLLSYRDPPDPLADFATTGWVLDRKPRADAADGWRAEAFRLLGPPSRQSGSLASSPIP